MVIMSMFRNRKRVLQIQIQIIVFFFLLLFLFNTGDVFAQSKAGKQSPQKGGRKVIQLKELVIKQRVIKPQAMFILTKSRQAKVKADIVTSQNFSYDIIKTAEEDFLR